MNLQKYRRLTNQLYSAIRNVETCNTERERLYTLFLLHQYSHEASISYCRAASTEDIESMDLALQSVLEIIESLPENQFAKHYRPDDDMNNHQSHQEALRMSLH